MSPLGQKVSDWVRTKPGMFRANSEHEALELGFAAAVATGRMKNVTFTDFCDSLNRSGYWPTLRTAHGDPDRPTFWVLALPEAA